MAYRSDSRGLFTAALRLVHCTFSSSLGVWLWADVPVRGLMHVESWNFGSLLTQKSLTPGPSRRWKRALLSQWWITFCLEALWSSSRYRRTEESDRMLRSAPIPPLLSRFFHLWREMLQIRCPLSEMARSTKMSSSVHHVHIVLQV